jgi:hypothetical protein
MTPEKAGAALASFLKDTPPGGALTIWRDTATGDWHVLQDGDTFNLNALAEAAAEGVGALTLETRTQSEDVVRRWRESPEEATLEWLDRLADQQGVGLRAARRDGDGDRAAVRRPSAERPARARWSGAGRTEGTGRRDDGHHRRPGDASVSPRGVGE